MIKTLTCIECPIGCEITVEIIGEKVIDIQGNTCIRGKKYAESEVVCPKRVVTTTVRADDGEMIPVKTDKPVKKEKIFEVIEKINGIKCTKTVKQGGILLENVSDGANVIVTGF